MSKRFKVGEYNADGYVEIIDTATRELSSIWVDCPLVFAQLIIEGLNRKVAEHSLCLNKLLEPFGRGGKDEG